MKAANENRRGTVVIRLTRKQAETVLMEMSRPAEHSEQRFYRREAQRIVDRFHDAMGYVRRNWTTYR